LPTLLIAAFRATLEEVIEADVIVHVKDAAHADAEAQGNDVAAILRELGLDPGDPGKLVEVWNKIDLIDADARERLENVAARRPKESRPVLLSALTGEGIGELLDTIEARVVAGRPTLALDLDPADGAALAWLHRQCEVLSRRLDENGRMAVTVRVDASKVGEVRRRFPSVA
jgi:GTP-binding protein HflX